MIGPFCSRQGGGCQDMTVIFGLVVTTVRLTGDVLGTILKKY